MDAGSSFSRLCEIVAQLRAPGGCPWDREQTHESLSPGLLEEAYEVADAIRSKDDANLREELGDLLLQVVLHAEIAAETGRFNLDDIARGIGDKLIRRHPHVFPVAGGADRGLPDAGAVLQQWDEIKRAEKGPGERAFFAGLTRSLPALMLAQKTQSKAARVNFDWSELSGVMAKVDEELAETKEAIASGEEEAIADEVGDLLFAVVNLARKSGLDAETVLAAATEKFIARFHALERELQRLGGKLGEADLAALDEIWNRVKKAKPLA
ncbi:MAG: nucleoside triphosphate pyrophosphohydrolase [Verrucomicrobiota bacterium]|nr:nucleoside triphosphate pyrophosphohydrolase [Verrucomicrobiota bacterium]